MPTEKEAKEMWCPYARQQDGANRFGTVPMGWCLASQCMAWRWLAWHGVVERQGYCGLAGNGDAGDD